MTTHRFDFLPAAQWFTGATTVGDAFDAGLLAYAAQPAYFGHGFADAEHEINVILHHVLTESSSTFESITRMVEENSDLGTGYEAYDDQCATPLNDHQRARLTSILTSRLIDRKPLPYVLKEAWQGEFAFYVDERVLIPRSYIAELLFDGLVPWVAETSTPLDILDLCCGSGCLGIIAAHMFPHVRKVTLADISGEALDVAQINVNRYFIDQKKPALRLVRSDVFDELRLERFDLILSNPPYVTDASMLALPQEYRHEPALALAAGEEGLSVVDRILAEAPERLKPGGVLVVEVGNNQDLVMRAHPRAPLTWLDTPNSEGAVFITTREDLLAWR
jgi:ribosomal protein L3 glutamine methyltransferase